jgi:hypothetical protein
MPPRGPSRYAWGQNSNSRAMFRRSNAVGCQHAIRGEAPNALPFVKRCDLSRHQPDSSCSGFPQLVRGGLETVL